MSETTLQKPKHINLKELIQLFVNAAESLPTPFDSFASKLVVLTRHVLMTEQRLRAIDGVIAQMAQVIVELKQAQAPQAPAEQAATPTAPQQAAPSAEAPAEQPAQGQTVEELFEEAKQRIKARSVPVEEEVVVLPVAKANGSQEQAAS